MRNPLKVYQANIQSLKTLETVYAYLNNNSVNLDIEEILRAEYVLIISAFDCYIHDIVRCGILDIFSGKRIRNRAYDKFSISMEQVKLLINDPSNQESSLAIFLKQILSKDSFQSPCSIEYATNLISLDKIWKRLKPLTGMEADDIKKKLSLIIKRRNQIAHEADLSGSFLETKNPISLDDILSVSTFITTLVEAINTLYKDAQMITQDNS